MADGFSFSGIDGKDGLAGLIADFEREVKLAPGEARKVVAKGAINVTSDWRKRWSGHAHAPRLPYAVGYDLNWFLGGKIEAEIGPDKDKPQGALGNLFEYGSVNNAPIPGGAPALEAERPKFEKAMENLVFRGSSWR
jgi:hypothetical protein